MSTDAVRVDVWLDVACIFKTRSQAQAACKGGKVEVNGERAKPHKKVKPGDKIKVTLGPGHKKILKVLAVTDKHLPKAKARELYEDLTPPPTPEELEMRRLLRTPRPAQGAPSKRDRRKLRRLKERGW